jgi:tetratricopeptide (TPR) repeat protein
MLVSVIVNGAIFISYGHADDKFSEKYRAYQGHVKDGYASFNKKDYQTAIDHYTRAIEMSPFEASHYYYRGLAGYRMGKEGKAIDDFNRAIILDARRSSAYVYRGLCREKRGEYTKALKDYSTALNLNPKDASIHNNLAWLYATSKDEKFQDKNKALEHAKRAAELSNEKNAEILDTLARAYFINGRVKEAIETERKAIELAPYNDGFKENLKVYEESDSQ